MVFNVTPNSHRGSSSALLTWLDTFIVTTHPLCIDLRTTSCHRKSSVAVSFDYEYCSKDRFPTSSHVSVPT
jgi:hypothetical protein